MLETTDNYRSRFMQSILLGYTYKSSIAYSINTSNYITHTNIFKNIWFSKIRGEVEKITNKTGNKPTEFDYLYIADMLVSENKEYISKNISLDDILIMYKLFYKDFVNASNTQGFTQFDFEQEQKLVEHLVLSIQQNEKFKLFARANDSINILNQEMLKIWPS